MTEQQWIRKPTAPPSHIRYAHDHGRGMLTFGQIEELVKAINSAYTARKQGGMTYLAQHQARAEMNRIFGYGNWDLRADDATLLYETRIAPGDPGFPKNGKAPFYWLVGYRISVTVDIRDLWGMPVASYTGVHAEENAPQPNRGEAHALALTSVDSYALRRALINLGDRFGLGLYNGGSLAPHGQYTHQLTPGDLFQWAPAEEGGAPAPAAIRNQPSHETIQAEPAVLDEEYAAQLSLNAAEQHMEQQAPQQGGSVPLGTRTAGGPKAVREAAAQLQAQRQAERQQQQMTMPPEMAARLQAGLKTNGEQ
ncbi:MAG TPA: Rad52/Rad22 family DNA repair protein [Aggregatilineales bacterium]|nr:Rad52/Rad22 family DNA repair protein [Aggregatilineales bacterium]